MSVPQRVLGMAAARRLGEPIRAFDARPGFRRAVAWLVLLGLAGLLLVASTVSYLIEGPVWLGMIGLVLAIGYLGGVVWILRTDALRGWGQAVYLFEYGFVRLTRRSRTAHHWDDLHSVTMSGRRSGPHRPTEWRFAVADASGAEIVLGDELPDVGVLGEVVVREVTLRMVPRYLQAVEAGETVRLGPFTVGPAGVEKDGETAPWQSVREVGVDNGLVFVRHQVGRPHLAETVGRVPNAVAFVELCDRIRTGSDDPARSRR